MYFVFELFYEMGNKLHAASFNVLATEHNNVLKSNIAYFYVQQSSYVLHAFHNRRVRKTKFYFLLITTYSR